MRERSAHEKLTKLEFTFSGIYIGGITAHYVHKVLILPRESDTACNLLIIASSAITSASGVQIMRIILYRWLRPDALYPPLLKTEETPTLLLSPRRISVVWRAYNYPNYSN